MPTASFSDEEYGRILDEFVIACVDVAIIYGNQILLEERAQEPAKNALWLFGGRMQAGEDFSQTARRSLQRELQLDIPEQRFVEVGTYNLRWPRRREPVSTNGCHHLLIAHTVTLLDSEKVMVDTKITDTLNRAWYDLDELDRNMLNETLHEVISKLREQEVSYV
jgi:ADP-ribose pyrophosphatase YjhB (NUDIX family)